MVNHVTHQWWSQWPDHYAHTRTYHQRGCCGIGGRWYKQMSVPSCPRSPASQRWHQGTDRYHPRVWKIRADSKTLKPKICHDANFVLIGGTDGWMTDNLWYQQWRQSCHHDTILFSVKLIVPKYVIQCNSNCVTWTVSFAHWMNTFVSNQMNHRSHSSHHHTHPSKSTP